MAGSVTAGTAAIRVVANTAAFETSLRRTLKTARKNLGSFMAAGAALAGASIFGNAIQDSIALEKQVKILYTLLDTPAEQGIFSTQSIRNFSDQTGLAAVDVAKSLQLIVGSGIPAADAYEALDAAQKNAVVSATDLETVTKAQTALMNAYGEGSGIAADKVRSANQIANTLFTTFKEGTASFKDVASYMSTLTPTASALGVSLEDVAAASASNTLSGTAFRKVATGLSYALSGLNDSTKGTGKAFKETTGKSFKEFIAKGGDLKSAIEVIGKTIGSSELTNQKGARQGLVSLQQLMVQWQKYSGVVNSVTKTSANNLDKQYALVNSSVSRQIELAKNRIKNLIGSIGDAKLPFLANLGMGLNEAIKTVEANLPRIQQALAPMFQGISDSFQGLWTFLTSIDWATIGSIMAQAFTPVIATFVAIGEGAAGLGGIVDPFNSLLQTLQPLAPLLAGVVGSMIAYRAAALLGAAATGVMTAAQWLWTTALAASTTGASALAIALSTIGWTEMVVALGFIVGAFIAAWKSSETFRQIVVDAVNATKGSVATAVEWIVNSFLGLARIIFTTAKKILDAWSYLPDLFGGGKANNGAQALQGYIDETDALIKKVHELAEAARNAHWELTQALNLKYDQGMHEGMVWNGKNWVTGTGNYDFPGSTQTPKIDVPNFDGSGWSDDADKKAKTAADKLKDALKSLNDVFSDLLKNTRGASREQIGQMFDKIFEGLDKVGRKDLKSVVVAAEKNLLKLSDAYAEATKKLEQAIQDRNQLVDDAKSFRKDLEDSIRLSNKITDDSPTQFRITFNNIKARQDRALRDAKAFVAGIKQLQKLNLNDTQLRQLIEAGPGAIDNVTAILRGGKAGIDTLNKSQKALDGLGKSLGDFGYDTFYASGIKAADSFVAELEAKQDKIGDVMETAALRMARRLQKELGIKQSTVKDIGSYGVPQVSQVLDKKQNKSNSQTINFQPGSISVVGQAGSEKKSGSAVGLAVIDVLAKRGVAAALAGTR